MANAEAQASPVAAPVSLASFNIRVPILLPIMAVALVVRLLLATIPGFNVDMSTFTGWSNDLANDGPWNFYQADKFTDYAPGYMYILWLIGEINQVLHFSGDQFEYVLKIPSIVADLASAYLVYRILDKKSPLVQLGATVIYLFFPAALLIGALWGQVDSILAFFLLLSVYFLGREKPVAAAVAFAVGFLIKPQAIAALPFLVFWILRQYPASPRDDNKDTWLAGVVGTGIAVIFAMRLLAAPNAQPGDNAATRASGAEDFFASDLSLLIPLIPTAIAFGLLLWRNETVTETRAGLIGWVQARFRMPPRVWVECAVLPLLVVLVLITPFFKLEPWNLFDVLEKATNTPNYRVNSFWAYNFWNTGGLFEMGFRCDVDSACTPPDKATDFLGIDARYWSVLLFTMGIVAIIAVMRNARDTGFLALGVALSILVFYIFLTRMHERYVFAFFLPALVACALIQSRALWSAFVVLSVLHFINLYHVFGYYYFFNKDYAARYPEWVRSFSTYNLDTGQVKSGLYRWFENQNAFGSLADLPLIPAIETVQLMSILFVISFLVLVPLAYYLVERRASDPGPEPETVRLPAEAA